METKRLSNCSWTIPKELTRMQDVMIKDLLHVYGLELEDKEMLSKFFGTFLPQLVESFQFEIF